MLPDTYLINLCPHSFCAQKQHTNFLASTISLFITHLRLPLFLCRGVGRPLAQHPMISVGCSASPELPSSFAAPTCRPWYECCMFVDSLLPPEPGPFASRQPAACRLHRASGFHGQSFSECHCPAADKGWWRGNNKVKRCLQWWESTVLEY